MLFGAFQPPSPHRARARYGFSPESDEDIRTAIAREKQRKGWRSAKKLNLIRTIHPEFKDLAQTWGWKTITVHEKMYPLTIKCVSQQILLSGGVEKLRAAWAR
jgi:hypothetical protein